jgi:hypothetical protein
MGFGLAWLALACNDDRARKEAEAQAEQVAKAANADPELQDPLGQSVRDAAREHAAGFIKMEHLWRGELATRERRAFLAVLPYGHCYRFVAAGGTGVEDLDLALFDPNGVEVQRDVTQESSAVIGEQASLCPVEPGAYRIEARMRSGAGPFAIGLYRDLP